MWLILRLGRAKVYFFGWKQGKNGALRAWNCEIQFPGPKQRCFSHQKLFLIQITNQNGAVLDK